MTEEQQQILKYLRMSPRDSLKKSAADLIEDLHRQLLDATSKRVYQD